MHQLLPLLRGGRLSSMGVMMNVETIPKVSFKIRSSKREFIGDYLVLGEKLKRVEWWLRSGRPLKRT